MIADVKKHYDMLIDEENDPFRDPPALKSYMDKWDGKIFIDCMELSNNKTVLEIGIGTGRIAEKTAPICRKLYGIDISEKTVERAKENLSHLSNIELICADFTEHIFNLKFDVIYSSLTFMHFEDKQFIISKIADLLKNNGLFVLSIDKSQSEYINFGTRKVKIYPDSPEKISVCIKNTGLTVDELIETEFAYIFKIKNN